MKRTIGYQLFTRGVVMLLLIILLAAAGQICISILDTTSSKVFEEYKELDVLQEYRSKLGDIVLYFDRYRLNMTQENQKRFNLSVSESFQMLDNCKRVLTNRHDKTLLNLYVNELTRIDSLKNTLSEYNTDENTLKTIHLELLRIVDEGIKESDKLLLETKVEIEEYIQTSRTAVKHSTITIIVISILFLLIVSSGGFLFIKRITSPIASLLNSTKKVGIGMFEKTTITNTNKEFKELAESFNEMIVSLEKTTISRNYYDSILRNMIEPVMVTDVSGNIQSVNQVTVELLKFNWDELKGRNITDLILSDSKFEEINQMDRKTSFRLGKSEQHLINKSGIEIPVLLSVSAIKDENGNTKNFIFLAHDLTEKRESERIIEKERKEKLIAIHDAQEEEKFRIAADLHDGLGQILTSISYTFQNLFGELNKDDSEYQKNVNHLHNQIDNAVRETKIIARNLIPLALKDFGLLVAINNLMEQISQKSKIAFSFNSYNFKSRINSKLEKAIYRIFQEATNNIIKHSNAKTANLQINKYDNEIVISIEDDGFGFDMNELSASKKPKGMGLTGMRERVLAFNGSFTINSQTGSGTEILIEIPC